MDTKKSDLILVGILLLIALILSLVATTDIPKDYVIWAVNESLNKSINF